MDTTEALKELKSGKVRPVYVAYGSDRYRMEQFASQLADKLFNREERELGIVKFDTSETAIEEAAAEAETLPFFVDKKLIVIRDASVLAAAGAGTKEGKIEHRAERMLEYIEQPLESTIILFMVYADKLDERRKLVKRLKEQGALLSFNELEGPELRRWVVRRASDQGRTMEDDAAELLVTRTGNRLQQLAQETDKLCLYAGEGGRIDVASVEELTASTVEEDVFSLIDAIASMQKDKALRLYRELLLRREEPIKIAALLASQLRLMLQVKELSGQQYSPQQIASHLGIHPFRVKLAAEKSTRLSVQRLGESLSTLAELDYRMKTGQVDKTLGLELFLLSFGVTNSRS
ncbi:DNA polymerase III delta subunit [Paenibacillus cellulosilyticus]|uniref:DNA polymerase III subunit delta n=1 Tax=Paenibacillus cellulosilyticus TaxID=375489 RepID=A0A2V2YPT6_9BACL|nr:DNA polymerase III subunit delta [Paenibacillus cellulosilyticus]PWV98404.1 DNA polymerase III delta subunit [Paenibacillus cellulosilyticus]QKS43252.1 DNA polymerase III subunit delta [Paenibacillus cellulosilyticus]